MTQQSIEAIQKQNRELLRLNENTELSDTEIKQVEAFLKTLAAAGAYIEGSDERGFLDASILYWINFITQKTGQSWFFQLQPFDSSQLKNQVFISYSHKDRKWVEMILSTLKPLLPHVSWA